MSTNDSSDTSECVIGIEDLPELAKSLPRGYDETFFTNVALLPASALPSAASTPLDDAEEVKFAVTGSSFSDENFYRSTVQGRILNDLCGGKFSDKLRFHSFSFGRNVASDG